MKIITNLDNLEIQILGDLESHFITYDFEFKKNNFPVKYFDNLIIHHKLSNGFEDIYKHNNNNNNNLKDEYCNIIYKGQIPNLLPKNTYTWEIYIECNGRIIEKSVKVKLPLPVKPFDSWIWNEEYKIWISPKQYPDDDNIYYWNESELKWKLML